MMRFYLILLPGFGSQSLGGLVCRKMKSNNPQSEDDPVRESRWKNKKAVNFGVLWKGKGCCWLVLRMKNVYWECMDPCREHARRRSVYLEEYYIIWEMIAADNENYYYLLRIKSIICFFLPNVQVQLWCMDTISIWYGNIIILKYIIWCA